MANAEVIQHVQNIMRAVDGVAGSHGDPYGTTHIADSWIRCAKEYRLDPGRRYQPTVIDTPTLNARRECHHELISVARAEMDLLYEQIAGSGYALLLTDASGIILSERVDPTVKTLFNRAGLIEGADWSEPAEGTNGIGTCIAERRAVTIHRNEHFNSNHIGLSCSGALILDPNDNVAGVLDASCLGSPNARVGQSHTMTLVNMSASAIEKSLFLRRYRDAHILRFHIRPEFVNLLHDGALAIAPDGMVIGADKTAVNLLAMRDKHDLLGRHLNEIIDTRLEELLSPHSSAYANLCAVRERSTGHRYFVNLHSGAGAPHVARRVQQAISTAATTTSTVSSVPAARRSRSSALSLEELAGDDPQLLRNARNARRVANTQVAMLLQGPTGSGKEVFARALHAASNRAAQPFVAVNCAAIPDTLIEAELFGYRPGAFTGARKEGMKGKILQASGGSLFLDEIGDMPPLLQTRLLRVLQEQEIFPLGSETPVKVDVRVISATHRNLRDMVAEHGFREDLYYRLNGITLELPALVNRSDRERVIHNVLASETDDGNGTVDAHAMKLLCAYSWPGNIRELRNVIRTALAICDNGTVTAADLPREVRELDASFGPRHANENANIYNVKATSLRATVSDAERTALLQAIEANRWNMTSAARQLGMSRNTLYRKLKLHGIALTHS